MTTDKDSPSERITAKIAALGDWRADTLARLRQLILAADDAVVEAWKWDGPVWECDGILCTGETYKAKVKLTFPHGAALPDPKGLFNSSLEGKVRRAIDFGAADEVDAAAFKALIRAAIQHNRAK
ncbi:DUF1801 domain-containing protein [Pelomonas sp. Root1444]|uniref:DUF1801 domain-containing protein n=1 Tax=Pelomonas sp. Root1444 TaxID=1736464 RepID=UPI0007029CB1|nr:DUF1801 domain-containing protein [Pelomonas sp. Root1444]KQY86032.1 hypothetical protein ASD35_20615 [Pelomonas sp. Root1444]